MIKSGDNDCNALDSVLFINVNYDKVMQPYCDPRSGWCGRVPIVDRHKLLLLLQFLKTQEEKAKVLNEEYYKFILFDVFLGDDVTTEWDNELFSTILSMPRIVIPYREGERIADERLMQKAFLAKYSQSILIAGFTKYPYYIRTKKGEWEETLPAAVFEEMTGRKIKKIGPLYFDGWRLAKRSCFLPLDVCPNYWQNLGVDLLDDTLIISQNGISTICQIGDNRLLNSPNLTKNKIIVIGSDQGDDMHNTFKGELAGAAVNYNALVSMQKGRYRIELLPVLFLLVVYFLLTCYILGNGKMRILDSEWYRKLKTIWKILIFFLLALFGCYFVLKLCCILLFFLFDRIFEIFIVSILFSLLSFVLEFKKYILS
ncbi:MAG: hypothetical protein K5920_02625 [Bacteroidales bacterium]|nr:hypothetical protein [Bacteroidales bacterium]